MSYRTSLVRFTFPVWFISYNIAGYIQYAQSAHPNDRDHDRGDYELSCGSEKKRSNIFLIFPEVFK